MRRQSPRKNLQSHRAAFQRDFSSFTNLQPLIFSHSGDYFKRYRQSSESLTNSVGSLADDHAPTRLSQTQLIGCWEKIRRGSHLLWPFCCVCSYEVAHNDRLRHRSDFERITVQTHLSLFIFRRLSWTVVMIKGLIIWKKSSIGGCTKLIAWWFLIQESCPQYHSHWNPWRTFI